MTVANTTTKLQYKGNGENRTFGITFPLADGSHLRLFLTTPQGMESEITKILHLAIHWTALLIRPWKAARNRWRTDIR